MSAETIIYRAWRLIPSVFRERIVGGWANEPAIREKILKEFDSSPVFPLQPATDENITQIALGKQDGYYLERLKDGQINLHFSPLVIIQREDLLDGEDIPSFGFHGYITFDPLATELFQGRPLNTLVLGIKYREQSVHLVDLFPQMGMTLQAVGFSDERVFYNSTLFFKHKSDEKFVVKFMPPGGMGEY